MAFEYGKLERKKSRMWGFWSKLSVILIGKFISGDRLWVVVSASHSNPAGLELTEKGKATNYYLLSDPSLGRRFSWRILLHRRLKKSESLKESGDWYMTKIVVV